MDLKAYIRDIPDFPKPGILFKDITPLLSHPQAFSQVIHSLKERYEKMPVDVICAAEARGFIFAAPLAFMLKKPFVPLRKPGKLPYKTFSTSYALEYGEASLHIHTDALSKGQNVLLIDDLLATGGTMKAAKALVDRAEAKVLEYCFIIELGFLEGRKILGNDNVFSLLSY